MVASAISQAATVTVHDLDTATNADWRKAAAAKPADPDGDNIYGSDGYVLFNWTGTNWNWVARNTGSDLRRLPSYIAAVSDDLAYMYRNDGIYGTMNDPDLTSANHPGTVIAGRQWDFNTITIQRQDPNQSFSLTVVTSYDLYDTQVWVHSGNIADAVRGDLLVTAHATRYRTFDIGPGSDPVVVRIYSQGNNISGLAFDHASATSQTAVLQNFDAITGLVGEIRTSNLGVSVAQPDLVSAGAGSPSNSGRLQYSTGASTATLAQAEFYAAPVVIPSQCIAFNWLAKAAAGFSYTIAIEDTATWTRHVSPRMTQTLDQAWQMTALNIGEFQPPLTAGTQVANIYITIHGALEGGLAGVTGEALFDDFRFNVPRLVGPYDADHELSGYHIGLPLE
jgi:hypothetical protein